MVQSQQAKRDAQEISGYIALVCEGLSRSRECPLIVNILTFVNLAVSSELLLMLSAHSARFKELAMYFGKGPSNSAFPTLAFLESRCQGQFPALERLALFVVSPPQENNLPYSSLFSNVPKLKIVELGIERPADALDLPWQQLKTVRLHSYSKATRTPIFNPVNIYDFLVIVRRCTSLEECSVDEMVLNPTQSLNFGSEAAIRSRTQSAIRTLSTNCVGVLEHLALPNLAHLRIASAASLRIMEALHRNDTLADFFDMSGCHLDRFSISRLPSESTRQILLAHLPLPLGNLPSPA
jgi:hypothetical protein